MMAKGSRQNPRSPSRRTRLCIPTPPEQNELQPTIRALLRRLANMIGRSASVRSGQWELMYLPCMARDWMLTNAPDIGRYLVYTKSWR